MPCATIYHIVNDVEHYPKFITSCKTATVLSSSKTQKTARLKLAKGIFEYDITTQNTLDEPHSITMDLIEGPLSYLKGAWRFAPENGGTKIDFSLDFEMKNSLTAKVLTGLMVNLAQSMVQRFSQQALKVHSQDEN